MCLLSTLVPSVLAELRSYEEVDYSLALRQFPPTSKHLEMDKKGVRVSDVCYFDEITPKWSHRLARRGILPTSEHLIQRCTPCSLRQTGNVIGVTSPWN
jgi:hypothetical protein